MSSTYSSCDELPFTVFKQCCAKKAYHLLGKGTPEQQQAMWADLYSEFCTISGDDGITAYVQQMSRKVFLESRIGRVEMFCALMQQEYSEDWAKQLRDMGYGYDFTPASYIKDVERCLRKLNNYKRELEQINTDLLADETKNENKELDYWVFNKNLIEISTVFKVPINEHELTAATYAAWLRQLKEYSQQIQNQQNQEHANTY